MFIKVFCGVKFFKVLNVCVFGFFFLDVLVLFFEGGVDFIDVVVSVVGIGVVISGIVISWILKYNIKIG